MDKAVLVMDMPDSCKMCRLCKLDMIGDYKCVADGRYLADVNVEYYKPVRCPLRNLPEKLKYGEDIFNGNVKGWNDCLKAILGE